MENLAQQALHKLEVHEAQCAERLLRLTERVDEAHNKIDGINKAVLAIYPFIIAAIIVAEYMR